MHTKKYYCQGTEICNIYDLFIDYTIHIIISSKYNASFIKP